MSLKSMLSGNWFEQLATATNAIPATATPIGQPSVAPIAKIAVANQPDHSAANDADAWRVTIPPGTSVATIAKFRAASLALDASILATGSTQIPDPDQWCWPNSEAMNGMEIDTFMTRLTRFTKKGMPMDAAEALADKLVLRDRGSDDRRTCIECRNLIGRGPGSWRCDSTLQAGVVITERNARLPDDLVLLPKRCDGFSDSHPPPSSVALGTQAGRSPSMAEFDKSKLPEMENES